VAIYSVVVLTLILMAAGYSALISSGSAAGNDIDLQEPR
jgi:hypothetical protein